MKTIKQYNDPQFWRQGALAPQRWLPTIAATAIFTLLGALAVNAASPVVFVYTPSSVIPMQNGTTNASVLISAPAVKAAQVARQLSLTATVAPAGVIQKVTFAPLALQSPDALFGTNVYGTRMTVVPAANAIGNATITLTAIALGVTNTTTIPVNVAAVNQAPSFTLSTNRIVVAQNSGPQKILKVLQNLSVGPTNNFEKSQIYDLTVTETEGGINNVVMSSRPQIDLAGTLYFQPAAMSYGTNIVTVVMTDNGGTDNGGVDAFTNSFRIEVPNSSIAPTIDVVSLQNRTLPMYSSTNAIVYVCDADTAWTNLSLTATSSKTNVFVTVGTSYTPTNAWPANISRSMNVAAFPVTLRAGTSAGIATISLKGSDGALSTSTNTFTVSVISVVQPPSFTLSTNLVLTTENHATVVKTNFLKNISAGPGQTNLTYGFTCTTPSSNLSSTNVLFSDLVITNNGTLVFTPAPNSFGTNLITVVMTNSGSLTPYGGYNSYTNYFWIGVTPIAIVTNSSGLVNIDASDAVTYEETTNLTVYVSVYGLNGLNPTNFTLTPHSSDVNIATVNSSFVNSNDLPNVTFGGNAALFALTLSPNHGYTNLDGSVAFATNGSTTITLSATDGTGTNSASGSFIFTVLPFNDAPSTKIAKAFVLVDENVGAVSVSAVASQMIASSLGYADEASQTLSFTLSNSPTYVLSGSTNTDPTTLAITNLAMSPTGTLTFFTPPNTYGTNLVTVTLTDNGGTDNGGANSFTTNFVLGIAQIIPKINLSTNFVVVLENAGSISKTNYSTNILSTLSATYGTNYLYSARILTSSQIYYLTNWGDLNPKSDIDLGITNLALSADGILSFTTPPNVSGTNLVTITYQVWSGTNAPSPNNGVTNTYTTSFVLGIKAQNTPPVFSLTSTNFTVSQYATLLSIPHIIAGYSSAGSGAWESTQTVSFAASVASGDSNKFAVPPYIVGSNLVYTANGSAAGHTVIVTITATDNLNSGISNASQTVSLVFPDNAYTAASGTYAGLYFNTPDLGPVAVQSSGYLKMTLAADGTFTGYLLNGARTNWFTNAFNTIYADTPITFKSSVPTNDYILNIWMENGAVVGTVANSRTFPAVPVNAYKTVTATTNNYNIVVISSPNPTNNAPVGDSIIGLTVNNSGVVSLSSGTGLLADGSSLTNVAATAMCVDSMYPLYSSPTNGQSVIFGWLQFETNGNGIGLTTDSVVDWAVGAGSSNSYPSGFTNTLSVIGSPYASTNQVMADAIDFQYAWVILGDLYATNAPLIDLVHIKSDGSTDVLTGSGHSTSLTIAPGTGIVTGSFVNALGASTNAISIHGLVVPSANEAAGFFLDGSTSGELLLIGIGQ